MLESDGVCIDGMVRGFLTGSLLSLRWLHVDIGPIAVYSGSSSRSSRSSNGWSRSSRPFRSFSSSRFRSFGSSRSIVDLLLDRRDIDLVDRLVLDLLDRLEDLDRLQ